MKRTLSIITHLFLWLGSFAIAYASLVYFIPDERAAFIIEKLPLPAEDFYVLVLRLHVIAAILSLPGCLILSSKKIIKHWPRFHRWCGRVIGMVVIGVLVPTGFYLAPFARGGWGATFGFWLSGAVVLGAMVLAVRDARARKFASHRRYAFHVLGQLSVAVTSRAMLFVLEPRMANPDTAYLIGLWVPVLGTLGLIELLVSPASLSLQLRRIHERLFPKNQALGHRGPARALRHEPIFGEGY